VPQNKINQFADVTGDHQWIHIDIESAKRERPFRGPVARCFLTLSLIPAF
jgi:acyl dehydratase